MLSANLRRSIGSAIAKYKSKLSTRGLAALLGIVYIIRREYRRRYKTIRGVPAVPGNWFIGPLLEVIAALRVHGVVDFWLKYHNLYGETLVANLPMQPPIVDTIDPKNVEHMLKTNFDNYIKGAWFRDRLTDLLGNGIFNVDGHAWYMQRKTASHMFSQKQFKTHIWRVIHRNCGKLLHILRGTAPGEVVDVFKLFNRFTLDTIGEVGFARDIGSLDNADSPFLASFDRAQQISILRFVLPFWRLKRWLGLGTERDARHHFKQLSDYSMETVQLLKGSANGEVGDSFVGMFIKDAQKRGVTCDDAFLKDMVLNFLIAGRDTTAHSLSWTLWLVMGHPEVEEQILKEIDDVAGSEPITFELCGKLTYLQNVINEGLRLYPSVPSDSKVSISDDVLPDGSFIPAGTVMQFNPYVMGRSTKLWGEDADKFRPERWEHRDFPDLYTYPVFNAGPRECLGKRLAWVEMKACLAEVLRVVRFELAVPRDTIRPDTQLTIGMSSGLPCRVYKR
eukprot:TRINITY_DN23724_c0_g1_i1.p1 TRINITY_DN23724_c0_g1~~TRINITY_DN23724_c0_g1_i1.p1  ORF type:complete len:506 (-),score=60.22 TRINITY_DN23724_c0_g1_i1:116-1633(-)